MVVMNAEMFPVECVVRGYISGSAWKEYKASGKVCGIESAEGIAGIGSIAGTDLHSGNQSHQWSR